MANNTVKKQTDKSAVNTAVVVASLEKKALPLFKSLPEKISSKEDYESAASTMKVIKATLKQANETKRELIDPLNDVIKGIRELFRPFEKKVEGAETTLKLQMSIFLEETSKKLRQIEADLESGKIKKATTAIKKQSEIEISGNIRKVWKAICVDESKTPREYLVPDESKIEAALKEGKKVNGWVREKVNQIVI